MKLNKIFSSIFIGLSLPGLAFSLMSCSDTQTFYIANFESYMSPVLIDTIKSENSNVDFRYYGTNEDLERSFVRNYDVAIPSAYLMAKQANKGLLEKIDWKKFNIQYEINGVATPIETASDALVLFTPVVQTALTDVYDIDGGGTGGEADNLLNYGVPYFLQDFILGYRGPNVTQLEGDVTWDIAMNYFSGKVGEGLNYNKIAMIDDFRSIYSIPRIIETQKSGGMVNVNPPHTSISTIADFQRTYNYLSSLFGLNSFLLNSDSGQILNNFANPKGSQIGIMYNGDLLYAVQGGDDQFKISPNDIHLVRPKNTLITLDMMVINAKSDKKEKGYELIKKIALEGISVGEDITLYDNLSQEYKWGPMQNFDSVQYTTPLEKISNYVLSADPNSYFKNSELDPVIIDLCKKIFNVVQLPSDRNMFEFGLNDLEKSNMYQAFLREKGKF